MSSRLFVSALVATSVITFGGVDFARAATSLTVNPITWDVIGLDSNNVTVGPNIFPVGQRVCATGGAATNVQATFAWTSANPYINLPLETQQTVILGDMQDGDCVDAYFDVAITRNKSAWLTSRRYVVTATADGDLSKTSPIPRQIFVEKLVSQNRNATLAIRINGSTLPSGVITDLTKGAIYEIQLNSATATQGYEQLETFLNMPNNAFRVLAVETSYSANTSPFITSPTDTFYADACGWDANPTSPNYRTCIGGSGKAGGSNILTTYTVEIIGAEGAEYNLQPMLYDFSGSSYHYNSDFETASRGVSIVGPAASLTMAKSFTPKKIAPDGTSTLTLSVTNTSSFSLSGVGFVDALPTSGSATMVIDSIPGGTNPSNCGSSAELTAVVGGTTVTLSNAEIAAGATCTITVIVEVTGVTGTDVVSFDNITGEVTINNEGTGVTGRDVLSVQAAATCRSSVTIASWPMSSDTEATSLTATQDALYNDAYADPTLTRVADGSNIGGSIAALGFTDGRSWKTWGWSSNGQTITLTIDLTGFESASLQMRAANSNVSSGPQGVSYAINGGTVTAATLSPSPLTLPGTAWSLVTIPLLSTTDQTVVITTTGANQNTETAGSLYLDDITITASEAGCLPPEPLFTKSFDPDPIKTGDTSTLTFEIDNSGEVSTDLTSVDFDDPLPVGVVTTDPPVTGSTNCGTPSFNGIAAGDTSLSISGATIDAGDICTITVAVKGITPGTWTNQTGLLKYNVGVTSVTSSKSANATITVIDPPAIAKSFVPSSVVFGGSSTLSIVLTNPNASTLTGVSFSDTLPAGVEASTDPADLVTDCVGTVDVTTSSLSLLGGILPASSTCTISVAVTGAQNGQWTNSISDLTSTEGGPGGSTSATLLVSDPYVALDLNKQVVILDDPVVDPTTIPDDEWSKRVIVREPGQVLYYKFTVTNSGEVEILDPAISDLSIDPSGASVCSLDLPKIPLTDVKFLAQEASASCIVGDFSASTIETTLNTATASGSWFSSGTSTSPVTSTRSTTTASPASLALTKSASPRSFNATGDVITFSFAVTNTGLAPLEGPVTVTDDFLSGLSTPVIVVCPSLDAVGPAPGFEPLVGDGDLFLDPGETVTCTATYTVTADDVTAGSIVNTATASIDGVESNSAEVTVPYGRVTLVKSANRTFFTTVGDVIEYSFLVENSGANQLDGPVTVSDPFLASRTPPVPVSCPDLDGVPPVGDGDTIFDPGELLTCTATYAVTADDLVAGQVDNVASATVDGVRSEDSSKSVYYGEISMQKIAEQGFFIAEDDVLTYSYIVRNNGTADLAGPVTVADDTTTVTCPDLDAVGPAPGFTPLVGDGDTTFDPGEEMTCTASYTVTGADVTAGSVTNVATATVANNGSPLSSPERSAEVPLAAIVLEKESAQTRFSGVGEILTYTYTVTNSTSYSFPGPVSVEDDKVDISSSVTCIPLIELGNFDDMFDPDEVVICEAQYEVTSADVEASNVQNVAVARVGIVSIASTNVQSNEDQVGLLLAQLTLEKSADVSRFTAVGDVVEYQFTVTNSGSAVLAGPVTVSDSFLAGLDTPVAVVCPALDDAGSPVGDGDTDLDPDEEVTCTASYTVTADDVTAEAIMNTATASVDGVDSNEDSVTVPFSEVTLVKSAKVDGVDRNYFTAEGDVVAYQFTVTNSGSAVLAGPVTVSDSFLAGLDTPVAVVCPALDDAGSPVGDGDTDFDPGEVVTCTASYTVTADDLAAGQVDNIATATIDGIESDQSQKTMFYGEISMQKSADREYFAAENDVISYSYVVRNNGTAVLVGPVSVADDKATVACPALDDAGSPVGDGDTDFDPGEQVTCTASYTVTADDLEAGVVTNLATATVDNVDSPERSKTVYYGEVSLSKVADKTFFETVGETLTYSYVVRNNGTAVLVGPVSVADDKATVACPALDDAGSPVGDGDTDFDPGEQVTCTASYTVTADDLEAGVVTNLATATVDNVDSPERSKTVYYGEISMEKVVDAASFSDIGDLLTYSYVVRNNGTAVLAGPVSVEDDKATVTCPDLDDVGSPVGDGDSDFDPGEQVTCTASYTVTTDDLEARFVTNLATATVENDGGDPKSSPERSRSVSFSEFSFEKTANRESFLEVEDVIEFSFTVSNTGETPLEGPIVVMDEFLADAGTSISCPSLTPVGLEPGIGNEDEFLDPDEEVICTASYTVTSSDVLAGQVTNTATASVGGLPELEDTVIIPKQITVDPSADLRITKSDGDDRVRDGQETVYTITVTNLGPTSVDGAILRDPVVSGITVLAIACDSPAGECTSGTLPTPLELSSGYALPVLNSGEFYSIIVTVRIRTTASSVSNIALIEVPDGVIDPNPENNSATDRNRVTRPTNWFVDLFTEGPLSNTGAALVTLLIFALLLIGLGGAVLFGRHRSRERTAE